MKHWFVDVNIDEGAAIEAALIEVKSVTFCQDSYRIKCNCLPLLVVVLVNKTERVASFSKQLAERDKQTNRLQSREQIMIGAT